MKPQGIILILLTILYACIMAQAPQSFKYQAIARDNAGFTLSNHNISVRVNIVMGGPAGTIIYIETHNTTTNQYGLFNIQVGAGTVVSGNFPSILWGTNSYYIKIELDPDGGSSYQDMGTTQLLSVPYALYADKAGVSGTGYVAGAGIAIAGDTIRNTAPDKIVTLTGAGTTTISGTYPNFTITSTGGSGVYTAGTGISIAGNVISNTAPSKWTLSGNNIYYAAGNVGIGVSNPTAKLEVAGQVRISGGNPGLNKILISDATGLGSWSSLTDLSGITGTCANNYYLARWTTSTNLGCSMIFDNGTNIGIGYSAPGAMLSVSGNMTLGTQTPFYTYKLTISGGDSRILNTDNSYFGFRDNLVATNKHGFELESSSQNNGIVSGMYNYPGYGTSVDHGLHFTAAAYSNWNNWTPMLSISASGNIGIGTVNPAEKLEVNGNIKGNVIISTVSGAGAYKYNSTQNMNVPDYVFDKYFDGTSVQNTSYNMLDLNQLRSYIQKHRHLPGVPSRAFIEKEGSINLQALSMITLEKVEELTLYTLQLEERNRMILQKLDSLMAEINQLKNQHLKK